MSGFRLIYEEDGYPRELAGEADRLKAIRDGRLRPDTPVTLYREGAKPEMVRAGAIDELKAVFAPAPVSVPAPVRPPVSTVRQNNPAAAPRPVPLPSDAPRPSAPEREPVPEEAPKAEAGAAPVTEAATKGDPALLAGFVSAAFLVLILVAAALSGGGTDTAAVSAPVAAPAPIVETNSVAPADEAQALAEETIQEWDASGAAHRFRVGDLVISLSALPGEGDPPLPVPVLTASAPGLGEGRLTGVAGFERARASFVVLRPNRRDARPSILLMTFSGGAHCCTDMKLLTPTGSGWRTAELGAWDGEAFHEAPRDVDGDGLVDFIMGDDRFLYAFAPYASSYRPSRIFNLLGGRFEDVSAAPRYASLHREEMENARQGCLERNNSACAAFAASAARVGEFPNALRTVESAYDRASTWGLPSACAVPRGEQGCPADQEVRPANFMAALQAFLAERGFIPPVAALNPAASGPAAPLAPSAPPAAIPAQFHGLWASARGGCRDPAYRYTVSADGVDFPQSSAALLRVVASSDERLAMVLAFEGEGRRWTSDFSIELAGAKALFHDGQGFRETLIRC